VRIVFSLILAALLADSLACQGVPDPGIREARAPRLWVDMRWQRDHPTQVAIVDRLRRLFPKEVFNPRLRRLGTGSDPRVILALGKKAGLTALREDGPAVLVTTGLLDSDGAVPPIPGVIRLQLAPRRGAYGRACVRFLPGVRRVACFTGATAIDMSKLLDFPKGIEVRRILVSAQSGVPAAVLPEGWNGERDAVLLPDNEALTPVAEALCAEARRRGIPVITSAGWLSRSGITLGVLPDLSVWTLRIAVALRTAARNGQVSAVARQPLSRILLDLSSPAFVRRRPSLRSLVGADLIYLEAEGGNRATTGR